MALVVAHNFELSKFPFAEWEWLVQYRRPYSTKARGDFMADKWVTQYEAGRYDLAVLHLDQQCIEPELWERGKGRVYRELNAVIKDIPKIVIMHGSLYYPEKMSKDEIREKVQSILGDNTMVTNSVQTAKDFGFGTPIIHGLDPAEWWDLPKEPRAVTMLSPAGLDAYYDRAFLENIRDLLGERGIHHCHITVDWQAKDWDDYRNFLGRSLIYINPTLESPMPRSRTEAMLSGACVISTPHHDWGGYIEEGVNGFLIKRDPVYVAKLCEYLLEHYDVAKDIGQRGKQTAIQHFGMARYQEDWRKLISTVLGREV